MEDNRVIGVAKRVAGRVESTAGALRGDTRAELRGKVRELRGAVQQHYGEATDSARDLIGSQSVAALLVAGAVGFVLGLALGRR